MKLDATLFDYFRSSASYRVRIALNLKNLEPTDVQSVDLRIGEQRADDYTNIAPQGLVPFLQFPDGTGIGQSLAIIEWLDQTYPEPRLIPADPWRAAMTRELSMMVACDIHPLNNLRVLQQLTGSFGLSEDQKNQWYHHWIHTGFSALENRIDQIDAGGPYCLGDQVTMADIVLVPQMYNARRFNVDLAQYPRLVAIDANLQKLPAFAKATPENIEASTIAPPQQRKAPGM